MSTTKTEAEARIVATVETATLIEQQHLAHENTLMATKWHEYRFMTPMKATKLFAEEFVYQFKATIRANIDLHKADWSRVCAKLDFSVPSGALTQMWLARQRADRRGIPYGTYLSFCFEFAMRRQRTTLPMPNQLEGGAKALAAWQTLFDNYWNEARQVSAFNGMRPMAEYTLENHKQLPAQEIFRYQLLELAKSGPFHAGTFYGDYVLALRYLDDDACAAVFGPIPLKDAKIQATDWQGHGRFSPEPFSKLGHSDMLQGCFGLPGAMRETDEPCFSCPHVSVCSAIVTKVSERLKLVSKTGDPVADARRAKVRDRVVKHRAKVASKASAAPAALAPVRPAAATV